MQLYRCLAVFIAVGLPVAASGGDADHQDHDAHVHGVAQLNVAIEGDELLAELTSPAMNIVGFEHAPRDDGEREAIRRAAAALEDAGSRLILPAAAGCRLESVSVKSALLEHTAHEEAEHEAEHDHDGHEEEHDEAHTEFNVRYAFHCDVPDEISRIEVALFEAFPGMERVELQVVTEKSQAGGELVPGDNVIRLGN